MCIHYRSKTPTWNEWTIMNNDVVTENSAHMKCWNCTSCQPNHLDGHIIIPYLSIFIIIISDWFRVLNCFKWQIIYMFTCSDVGDLGDHFEVTSEWDHKPVPEINGGAPVFVEWWLVGSDVIFEICLKSHWYPLSNRIKTALCSRSYLNIYNSKRVPVI